MILGDHLLIFSNFPFKHPRQTAARYENTLKTRAKETDGNKYAMIETKVFKHVECCMMGSIQASCNRFFSYLFLLSALHEIN